MPPRLIFGCGCPIYACLPVRHPDPTVAPFEFNGSLTKLGVREKLAAEELVDQWAVQFLSGNGRNLDTNTFKTVEQGIQDYLAEKRGALDASKDSTKLTIQKIAGILKPLTSFLNDCGVVYLKEVRQSTSLPFRRRGSDAYGKTTRRANSFGSPRASLANRGATGGAIPASLIGFAIPGWNSSAAGAHLGSSPGVY